MYYNVSMRSMEAVSTQEFRKSRDAAPELRSVPERVPIESISPLEQPIIPDDVSHDPVSIAAYLSSMNARERWASAVHRIARDWLFRFSTLILSAGILHVLSPVVKLSTFGVLFGVTITTVHVALMVAILGMAIAFLVKEGARWYQKREFHRRTGHPSVRKS